MAVLIVFAVIIIGVSEYKQNSTINTETTKEFTTVNNNETPSDISNVSESTSISTQKKHYNGDLKTNFTDLFREYSLNSLNITLNPDGYYLISDNSGINSLSGRYEAFTCNEAIEKDFLTKKNLSKIGIIYNDTKVENIYYIRANYENHVYEGNQEFYSFDIFKPQYYEFVICFREDNNAYYYAINNIDNKLSSIDITKPCF